MESISIYDGLMLTVVSMAIVFAILAALWGVIEVVARMVAEPESVNIPTDKSKYTETLSQNLNNGSTKHKHQRVAELMALILASEDEPNKKFEITESKRIK